jgi:hypothetical protein
MVEWVVLFTCELCPKKERLNEKTREPINKPIRGPSFLLLCFHVGTVLEPEVTVSGTKDISFSFSSLLRQKRNRLL